MAQKPQISSLMEKGNKSTVSAKDYGSHFTSKREVSHESRLSPSHIFLMAGLPFLEPCMRYLLEFIRYHDHLASERYPRRSQT